jgi:hypothetical protein
MNIHVSVQKGQHLVNSMRHIDPIHNIQCYFFNIILVSFYAANWTARGSNHGKRKRIFSFTNREDRFL